MIAGLTEIQLLNVILMMVLGGSMIGISLGVIARFLGDRNLT